MIHKCPIIFCENEHGTGDVSYPDVKALDGYAIQEEFLKGHTVVSIRKAAKEAGWGRVNGGDFCPQCMETM